MAITTLDLALAGMKYPQEFIKNATGTLVAGRPHATWYLAGIPGAGVASSAGVNGEILTSPVTGQIPFTNPASGYSYLARFQGQATISGSLLLIDKIWRNSGLSVTSTSEQTFTALQVPARDATGTTDGVGILAAIEVATATGAGTPTITLKYTNQAGVADKTATTIIPGVASSPIGAFYPIGLAAGDTGIQKQ
jgi:hypothetical protein